MQAPYVLSVSGNKNSYKLTNVGVTSTNQMKWHVNFPTGTQLWFQLIDGSSTDIYTNIVTVAASSDASCVNVTNPLITDSSTTSSSLPSTAYTSVLSSTMAVDASASPSPNNNTSSSHNSTGPIAGGIVAGVVVLLLLLLGLWWLRRSKRQGSRQYSKTELDLNAERHGMIVEPFCRSLKFRRPINLCPLKSEVFLLLASRQRILVPQTLALPQPPPVALLPSLCTKPLFQRRVQLLYRENISDLKPHRPQDPFKRAMLASV
ncbi:hypothetical protein FRC12_013531 [Ceratobasidium sp. 428]|nr:hypothetical protein FRC12_013531 [Ceratobasidium sp. 428]